MSEWTLGRLKALNARNEAIAARQTAIYESGLTSPEQEFAAIMRFTEMAKDDSKSPEDVCEAMEAHLSALEARMN